MAGTGLFSFSLSSLLVGLGYVAVGLAACVRGSYLMTLAWHLLVFGTFAFAVLSVVHRTKQARTFWLGFAIFGGTFFCIEQLPVLNTRKTVARVFEEELRLMPGVTEFHEAQAGELARQRVDLGVSDFQTIPPDGQLRNQTRDELERLRSTLSSNLTLALILAIAVIGGLCGRWLSNRSAPVAEKV